MCVKCGITETIAHLLYDCSTTNVLWDQVEIWISRHITDKWYLERTSILLGYCRNSDIINQIISPTKYEIYVNNLRNKGTHFHTILFDMTYGEIEL